MENFRRICFLFFLLTTVLHDIVSQATLSRRTSAYLQSQLQQSEDICGIQDKDELPDMHAAAPWAAALFFVEGDIFQNQLKPQYLNTAIFISKSFAITSGSAILAQQQSELHTKLQLYFGHRASGKQTLIRVRKVEALSPSQSPLALRLDTSPRNRKSESQLFVSKNQTSTSGNHAGGLYLLHLESPVDITAFSRPLCVNGDVFKHKNVFYGAPRSPNKVHISGYAAKNDSHGSQSHVVYFSPGDREWRVQSWDSDNIKIVMQDQQVSYGFLPKHFNSGSALTVKLNDQFFLVGILRRSIGSETSFISIEPFVDMIHMKVVDAPSSPFHQHHSSREAEVLQRPQITSPNGHQSSQHTSSPRSIFNGGGSVTLQQHPQLHIQKESSNVEQITYLKEVEQSEYEESRNPPEQISHVTQHHTDYNSNNDPHSGSKNPFKPAYTNSGATLRPTLSLRPTNIIPQRPPTYEQTHPRSDYFVSTTQRAVPISQLPQYVYHPDSQRQDERYQITYRPQQQQHQDLSRLQQTTRCSHDYDQGVDIECLTRQRGVSTADCIKNAPPGTKIRLTCKPHYYSLDGDKLIEKTCDASGNWLPRKTFACKLDCGNVDRSVPFIVHGSKTESEKWPWHTALFKKVNETTHNYICGATLITRSILITAAHCVHNGAERATNMALYKAVVGAISSDFRSNRKDPQAQEFNLKGVRINEHYNTRTYEADIALIQLEKPVVLTEYVRPICFPYPTDEHKQVSSYQLSEGNRGIVVGFGTTEDWNISRTLRLATLPVVSVKDCTNVLERLPSSSQYCAGYTNGTSVCEGDSGGAQIFKDQISKRYFVQGIISHGNRKEAATTRTRCDHEKYTVFTRVGSFAEWVKDAVYDLEYDYNRRRRK